MSENILKQQDEQNERQLSLNYLTPETAEFSETPGGFAALKVGGEEYKNVNILRTFPFTAEDRYLSVRKPDGKQEEIGIIEDLSVFDDATKELIGRQLKLRYFIPKINRIYSIKEENGHTYWSVGTDKGKCRFISSSGSAGAVQNVSEKRIIIKDLNENRYEITDITALTTKEMKKLDLYL